MMHLICTGCFTDPHAVLRNPGEDDAPEMLVCSPGAIALAGCGGAAAELRCDYCGKTVHLDHHHLAWYAH